MCGDEAANQSVIYGDRCPGPIPISMDVSTLPPDKKSAENRPSPQVLWCDNGRYAIFKGVFGWLFRDGCGGDTPESKADVDRPLKSVAGCSAE
jgi:hypothetical protein